MTSGSDHKELITRYRTLLTLCRSYLTPGDTRLIRTALEIADRHAAGKRNLFGEPALFFPIDLLITIEQEIGLGISTILSSLLYDAVVNGKLDTKEIEARFSPKVLEILTGLSRISRLQTEKIPLHHENFIRLLLSLSGDVRAILIKMAECLYYLRKSDKLPEPIRKRVATEAYYLYSSIAHRLGLYSVKSELEDLSMRYLWKDDYRVIVEKLRETSESREQYLEQFIVPLRKQLDDNGFHYEIKGRTKSIHSIWTKMKAQQVPFEDVFDLLAIRIILINTLENEKADCWKVYSLVTDIYTPNPERLRDWVSAPKDSGYESLHTTVQGPENRWVEVQIRSQRMDEIAELGHAAHWKYKYSKTTTDPGERMRKIREALENSEALGLEGHEMEPDTSNIFCFTPDGDLKKLPENATVLDFAYEIHTRLGAICSGAKVNGKIVPIKHVVHNGDEVEIITSKNQKPKKDWLSFVVTSRAKSKIKRALREDEMKEAEQGKDSLSRKFKNWKIPFNDEHIDKAVKLLRYKTPMDLYHAVATGRLDPLKVREALQPAVPVPDLAVIQTGEPRKEKRKPSSHEDYIFIDKHLENINYTLASCCSPIFGDDVFGFVTISKGITIHRVNCPNAASLKSKYAYRIIQVKWRETASAGSFNVSLKITGLDELGIVNSLTDIISNEMNVNMRSIAIETNNGIFEGTINVFISDTRHLEMLIQRLKKVKGILKVIRLEQT